MNDTESTKPSAELRSPIEVSWIVVPPKPPRGKLGMTAVPNWKSVDREDGRLSDGDLASGLDTLVKLGVTDVVCLLDERELSSLGISALPNEAERLGLGFIGLPVPANGIGVNIDAVGSLVERIHLRRRSQGNIVLLSDDGLGRTGAVAACVLVRIHFSVEDAYARVMSRTNGSFTASSPQRDVIDAYAARSWPEGLGEFWSWDPEDEP